MRDACQSKARWCADCFRVSAPIARSTSTSPAPSAIPPQSHFPDEARKRRLKRRFSIAPCSCLVQKFFSFIACRLRCNLPVADGALVCIKVDAHLDDGKSTHGKSGRVVLEVNQFRELCHHFFMTNLSNGSFSMCLPEVNINGKVCLDTYWGC